MNPDYEKQLEARVHRELETLGELPAPPALANRIMRQITTQPAAPWYRRAWTTWPRGWRFAALVVLVSAFGGLCFGAGELTRTITALVQTSGWFTDAQALWQTFVVLSDIAHSFTSRLGTGVIATALAVVFAGCVVCIGLGSACVRLALRPATNRI